ncbi:oligosaccharide flippase family protein [Alteromonas stellipolaris]|uniref:Oligosaccharide flippase family protein n=1 Tax=Alteromonas stellipolaris TaxID=233316 RepID=A0AAW7Z6V3_9ALTE|nr:oligosaccharide flippase family protein [Alteromonas stellipolaris]MDO6579043.1 oligosaccharide flippase family protein [Alteromonas stellipolaris]
MSIKKKATAGSLWMSLTRTGINVVDFLVYAYLARILTLEEFGLAGFCFLFIEFANTLVNAGVNQNLVQRKEWEDRYAASTMTFVFGMGLVASAGIVGIGAPIAYYSHSQLAALVVVSLAPITLVTSLQVVVTGKLLREFKNKQMGVAKFCATLLSAISIITMAENGYGIWALIFGKLINITIQYLFLIYVSKFKPAFNFDKNDFKELVTFCLPLFWMVVLRFLNKKASNLFTGFVLGPVSFALLAAAHKGEVVINQVTMSSINSMIVPSFSRVKEGSDLGGLFIRLVTVASTIVTPIFMGLAAIADPFVTVAFGEKFSASANYMTISAFSIFPLIIANFLPNLLISRARTKDAFNLVLVNIVCNVVVAGCTIWFGVTFMLISLVVSNFLATPVRLAIVKKHIFIDTKALVVSIAPSALSSIGMFLALMYVKPFIAAVVNYDIVNLVVLMSLGAVFYVSFSFIFFFKQTSRQVEELKSMLLKKKK